MMAQIDSAGAALAGRVKRARIHMGTSRAERERRTSRPSMELFRWKKVFHC
jgi:hypothetical protein